MVDSGSGGGSGGGESMKERRRSDGVRTEVGLDLPPATSFLFNTLSLSRYSVQTTILTPDIPVYI